MVHFFCIKIELLSVLKSFFGMLPSIFPIDSIWVHWLSSVFLRTGLHLTLLTSIWFHWLTFVSTYFHVFPLMSIRFRWCQSDSISFPPIPLASFCSHLLPFVSTGFHQIPLAYSTGFHLMKNGFHLIQATLSAYIFTFLCTSNSSELRIFIFRF